MSTVRCLNVRAPWAWAVVHADKDVENRTWVTSWRGWVAVVASKAVDRQAMPVRERRGSAGILRDVLRLDRATPGRAGPRAAQERLLEEAIPAPSRWNEASRRAYEARGAVLGLRRLEDTHRGEPGCCGSPWAESASGFPVHWCLGAEVVVVDPPIPVRGALGLWVPKPELGTLLEAMVA